MKRFVFVVLVCCCVLFLISCSNSNKDAIHGISQSNESGQSGFWSNINTGNNPPDFGGGQQTESINQPDSSLNPNNINETPDGIDVPCLCLKEALNGYWMAVSYVDSAGNVFESSSDKVYLSVSAEVALLFQWEDGVRQEGSIEWVNYNPASKTNTITVYFFEAASEDGRTIYESGMVIYTIYFEDEWQTLHMRLQDTGEELVLKMLNGPWD